MRCGPRHYSRRSPSVLNGIGYLPKQGHHSRAAVLLRHRLCEGRNGRLATHYVEQRTRKGYSPGSPRHRQLKQRRSLAHGLK